MIRKMVLDYMMPDGLIPILAQKLARVLDNILFMPSILGAIKMTRKFHFLPAPVPQTLIPLRLPLDFPPV